MAAGDSRLRNPGTGTTLAIATLLSICLSLLGTPAFAAAKRHASQHAAAAKPGKAKPVKVAAKTVHSTKTRAAHVTHATHKTSVLKTRKAVYRGGRSYGGISCVPYARQITGIEVKGNAGNWWANAAGIYQRGNRPELGSVMNFRPTGRMRLGHVAVVTRVIDSRTVEIDHANWAGPGATKGRISRGIPVIDVSEYNDWSSVRVGLGHSGDFGSVYPIYGFIYDRPDQGQAVAEVKAFPRTEEVAEAPTRFRDTEIINRAIR
jgi:surface antigen